MTDHDIMTVDEVAAYLRVSERTVYDWAQKGEIPCGKLGSIWRFERAAIEKWVKDRIAGETQKRPAAAGLNLKSTLTLERVVFLKSKDKSGALDELVGLVASAPGVKDERALAAEIERREGLMSTGIGLGVGIPHVRLDSVEELTVAVGISREGLDDYESLDGEPVHIVFMLAAPAGHHDQYLRLLASVSTRLKSDEFRALLLAAATTDEVFEILTA